MNIALPSDSGLKPCVALIAGPTASGKSDLAMALARRIPSTIINADASQVYRDLRVVTARPTESDETEVPHRLFGYVDGADNCSAASWAMHAREEVFSAIGSGRLPILVGGTGLYIRTILDGIAPVPEIAPEIRQSVRRLDVSEAYAALRVEDAEAAARLAPADSARVARALEVIRSTGRPISQWQARREGGIADRVRLLPTVILPSREWLYPRCEARFDAMLSRGAKDEVARLTDRQLDPSLPIMRAIGVREIAAALADPANAATHHEAARMATRRYAKRQMTWFRHQLPAAWRSGDATICNDAIDNLAIKLHEMALT